MLKFLSELSNKTNDGHIKWLCRCDCGSIDEYIATRVKNNRVSNCKKCAIKITSVKNTKHGMRNTATYSSWSSIKERCLNKNSKDFKSYGAIGITLCKQWAESFESFYLDMGEGPKGKSIDRIDNNLGYYKENCRWASASEQQKNKSNSCIWLINGNFFQSLQEAADFHKVKKPTIMKWVDGWTDKRRNKEWSAKDGCKRIPKY
jgi:hypothetical protein